MKPYIFPFPFYVMKLFSNKAQMSSPFELFVAVIIMTFVVIIGTQMLNVSQEQICLASIEGEISKFENNLQETANNRTATRFEFRPQTCYNENTATARIFRFNDSVVCGAKCGTSGMQTCHVLVFYTSDIAGGYIEKCLRISPNTSFVELTDGRCSAADFGLEGFTQIFPFGDSGNDLLSGTYALRNVSTAAQTYPSICIFRRS